MERDIARLAQGAAAFEPIFVARHPIFSAKNEVWGYKLLFRHSLSAQDADIKDPNLATSQVLADGFALAHNGLGDKRKALIPFPEKLLRQGAPLALPKDVCVVDLPAGLANTQENLDAVTKIKQAGFSIAVSVPCFEAFLLLSDMVRVDVLKRERSELVKIAQQLKKLDKPLLAGKVEDKESFDIVRALGFSYFQGFHFNKPQVVQGRKINPLETSRLQLVQQLSSPDYDVSKVARIIAADISLSYRLLRFINSAAFSFHQNIESLDHAISLLGQRPLKLWLMAVAVSDMAGDPKGAELTFLSMQRGRFLELLGEAMPNPPFHKDILLLLGLFSLLDALMDMDMVKVTEHLPLHPDVKAALAGEPNQARDLLDLAENVERGDWPKVNQLLSQFGLSAKDAAIKHNLAALWAQEVMSSSKPNGNGAQA